MKNGEMIEFLKKHRLHVATAESCTGGMIAAAIVDIPGASEVFEEGYVTYSNRIKEKNLSVSGETIRRFSVVSSQVAEEMAAGVCKKTGAELGISVTGYAGPDDAEDGTKAGTVYIGVCLKGDTIAEKFLFTGDRKAVRTSAAEAAFELALRQLEKIL